ncbi:MAG: lipid II flippase MurJ, partial [Acidobacteriota bacterium]
LIAAGQAEVDRFALTVRAVRIIFPGTALLVLSSWALGVLNSHRRFLLPYLSPLVWNASLITLLLWTSGFESLRDGGVSLSLLERGLFAVCFGALIGAFLQFSVQMPLVLRSMRGFRLSLSTRVDGVRDALRAFGPALAGRGVVQLSLYIDMFLASWLAKGAPSALGYAVTLINLPVGVFGMSVAAAELPELASADPDKLERRMSERISRALRQSAFVVAPSVVGFLAFGFLVAGLVFRGGSFTLEDNQLVYLVLCAYTVGLPASTVSRLFQNAFFALRDPQTPARIASVRLVASALLGAALMLLLDRYPVRAVFGSAASAHELFLGAVGLGLAASVGAWCELMLMLRALRKQVPGLRLPVHDILRSYAWAVALAAPVGGLWWLLGSWSGMWQALLVLPCYVVVYLGIAWWRGAPEIELWLGRGRRRA